MYPYPLSSVCDSADYYTIRVVITERNRSHLQIHYYDQGDRESEVWEGFCLQYTSHQIADLTIAVFCFEF